MATTQATEHHWATIETELLETLRGLEPDASVVRDESAPLLWSVWTGGEIIGASMALSEALEEAVTTVRGWGY